MKQHSAQQLATDARRREVAELRLQGCTQQAIAQRLQVTQSTISLDLKFIRRQWQKSMIGDFSQAQAEELQKLERIEHEAWVAWERSQKPSQSAVVQGTSTATARKTVKNQTGNPRFLKIVHDCIESRRDILGLDAPRKIASTDVEGRTITLTDLLGRIRRAAPAPAAGALVERSNVFDVKAELARRAPPPA